MGILNTLGLVVTLAFALPIALLGVTFVASGRTLFGGAMLAVAVLMIVVKQYVTTPSGVPFIAAEKVTSAVVKEPDDERDRD